MCFPPRWLSFGYYTRLPAILAAANAVSTRILGIAMRDAVRNKERWKGCRTPTQDPSTDAVWWRCGSWSEAAPLPPDVLSAQPRAVVLGNGALLLTAGRPVRSKTHKLFCASVLCGARA